MISKMILALASCSCGIFRGTFTGEGSLGREEGFVDCGLRTLLECWLGLVSSVRVLIRRCRSPESDLSHRDDLSGVSGAIVQMNSGRLFGC